MGNALMDQLLKAGVVDKKKANRAKQQKRDKAKKGDGQQEAQARARELEQQRKAKAERDRELNLQRQQEKAEKARQAQVKQWMEDHKIKRVDAEITYNFQHGERIPSILVTESLRDQLMKGQIRPVLWGDGYELLPRAIADRIAEIMPDIVVVSDSKPQSQEDEQAYADFPVPDDLIW